MSFYDHYPMMRPYVGKHFYDAETPALLLVGESHYLPEGSTQHLTPESWYAGDSSTLSETEKGWINTAEIVENSPAANFSQPGHSIWRNTFKVINESGPNHPDFKQVVDDIAFCNFFLRPGLQGQSLIVSAKDVEIANETFQAICDDLKPTGIVFLSTKARQAFKPISGFSIPVVATPHPTCIWWNRPAAKYGNQKGREVLADFIKSLNWRNAEASK